MQNIWSNQKKDVLLRSKSQFNPIKNKKQRRFDAQNYEQSFRSIKQGNIAFARSTF